MATNSRIFALHRASAAYPMPFRRFRHWQAAGRTRAELMWIDDRTLKDIGLYRSEVVCAMTSGLSRRSGIPDVTSALRMALPEDRPNAVAAYLERGRSLRAEAMCAAFESLVSALCRMARRLSRIAG